MYHNLGFNMARVDQMDWRYLDTQPATFLSLLSQVASAADANGVYTIYGFPQQPVCFSLSIRNAYASGSALLAAWWQNGVIPVSAGSPYAGMTLWEAAFQGWWKPVVQALDSHRSTVGYSLWNEPTGTTIQLLHNYYQYMAQRLRTVTSKAIVFQLNVGDSGSSGVISIMQTVAPTKDLAPIVFEGHMYSDAYSQLALWGQGAASVGAYGFIGETHNLDLQFYQQLKSMGWATEYYRWSCDSLLDAVTCQLTSQATQLSQVYNQVWGSL